jgi:DNA-binding NtrC family response regulator
VRRNKGNLQRTGVLATQVAILERVLVVKALREAKGKKLLAAQILGISRPTLDSKIEEFQLTAYRARPRNANVD